MKVCAVFAYENFEKQATWSFSQVALIALTTFLHTLAVLDIAVRKSSGLPFNAIGMKTVFQTVMKCSVEMHEERNQQHLAASVVSFTCRVQGLIFLFTMARIGLISMLKRHVILK